MEEKGFKEGGCGTGIGDLIYMGKITRENRNFKFETLQLHVGRNSPIR